ncbi:MAG: gamma-glutamyltransferase 2 [Herminiimonas sp.]|nr:gamma-glutamyltransferase 2 [Herminiimonas sp.]
MKKFDPALPYESSRTPVLARNVVATSQPLAAQAGLQMLAKGGNAIDAALAAAITLTVVEPTMNGIGGDLFALVWDGERLHGLNATGCAPDAWTPEYFQGKDRMPAIGWDTVTVPGAVSGWVELSNRFGQLPFEDLFERAIGYANNGYAVTPAIARHWAMFADILGGQPGFAESFLPQGRAPRAGERWSMPAQGATLAEIARTRGEAFYRGTLAKAIVDHAKATGGSLTLADLARHEAQWVEPIEHEYHGYKIHEIPPSGQGIAALIALGILKHTAIDETAPDSAARVHFQVEAMRLAFNEAYTHVADPRFMKVSAEELLDEDRLRQLAQRIDPAKASYPASPGPVRGGTVYLAAADEQGRMVSLIQSNFKGFGSGVVVPGTGISLHNRGMGFSLEPGHPNQVAPRKRPFHTIIPAFMSKDGQPVMTMGVMGGNMQPQGHLQVAMRYIDEGLNPQACSDAPRWRIDDNGRLTLEAHMPAQTVQGLADLGHDPMVAAPDSLDFGSAQLIARLSADPQDGYAAGSDHRRDGQAVGF